ncbi:Ig-like domain-containing protein [Actinomadura fulvescens]|uniref:Uncharacterized protein n=1 Tax=Actinomadura fulvescens TaxID=46160 RepID=A0ABN3QPT9_9ACTN
MHTAMSSPALAILGISMVAATVTVGTSTMASAQANAVPDCRHLDMQNFHGDPLSWNADHLCRDPDGDPLSVTWVSTPDLGTVSHSRTKVGYDSEQVVQGSRVVINVKVSDGQAEDEATLEVDHFDPRLGIPADDSYTVKQGESITFDVRDNDKNAAGANVYQTQQSLGKVVVLPDERLSYTARQGSVGEDSFPYCLFRSELPRHWCSPEATVRINVTE